LIFDTSRMRRGRASVERKRVLTDRRMRQKEKLGLYPHRNFGVFSSKQQFRGPGTLYGARSTSR
jgi:hypothetical protein